MIQFKIIAAPVETGTPAECESQFAATYLINGSVAIDAGVLGYWPSLGEQRQIRHVFLTHSHADHLATLPIFLENTHQPGPDCVTVYGLPDTLDSLRRHVFNDVFWPDLERLSTADQPFVKLVPFSTGNAIAVCGLQITPIAVDHVVPTVGFLVDDGKASLALVSDTQPTDAIWDVIRKQSNLRAVFLECAFPNSHRWLAERSKHLTPELFRTESSKLQRDVPLIAVHIKPAFRHEIIAELAALGIPRLQIGTPNVTYAFS